MAAFWISSHHDWKVRKLRKKKSPHFLHNFLHTNTCVVICYIKGVSSTAPAWKIRVLVVRGTSHGLSADLWTHTRSGIAQRAVGHRWTAMKSKHKVGVKGREGACEMAQGIKAFAAKVWPESNPQIQRWKQQTPDTVLCRLQCTCGPDKKCLLLLAKGREGFALTYQFFLLGYVQCENEWYSWGSLSSLRGVFLVSRLYLSAR